MMDLQAIRDANPLASIAFLPFARLASSSNSQIVRSIEGSTSALRQKPALAVAKPERGHPARHLRLRREHVRSGIGVDRHFVEVEEAEKQ